MIQSGYTKLFGSIVASTIWREDDKTRIVWITLLALSDRTGYVAGSLPGLADLARVSLPDCEKALEKLQQADKYSRSPEHNGRRIEVVDGGWLILNRAKYRDLIPDEHRRELERVRQKKHRSKKRQSGVTRDSHDLSQPSLQKEKEKEKRIKPALRTKRSESDPRFKPFVEIIGRIWTEKNTVPLVWDESEGSALKKLLDASPNLTDGQFATCVANRSQSAGVVHSERPRKWLADVLRYANGPLDRFGKTLANRVPTSAQSKPSELARPTLDHPLAEVTTMASRLDYQLPPNLDEETGLQLWGYLKQKLSERLNRHAFDTWFRPVRVAGMSDDTLYVKLPSRDFSHVGDKYRALLSELLGSELKVEFLVPQEVAC